ncbi:hypothetical protein C6H68_21400 [Photorhabdus luminescens]|nr:hypothetical protein C6H68_21400 [Photorhabdus luminescens]
MGFPNKINHYPAPGIEGAFASTNPSATLLARDGTLIAGNDGVTVGCFAWVIDGVVSNKGVGAPSGFVGRDGQASITLWLGEASMLIQPGREVTLFTVGDFTVRTSTPAKVGDKIYASLKTGEVQAAAAGKTITDFIETKFVAGTAAGSGELVKMGTWS